jgi:glycosyltransferase involved in cell wall biosynthesis
MREKERVRPTVSIGMPVYNGADYIRFAIESLLAQTYSDFELLIVDNASTDDTAEICREYAGQDKRMKYIRNVSNIGAAANFSKTFKLSSGEYFKWAAHDDIHAPGYLQRCIEQFEKNEDLVLCHTDVDVVDKNGTSLRIERLGNRGLQSKNTVRRFSALLADDVKCYEVFGLIRRAALQKTSLIAGYVASDRILRAELGMLGCWKIVNEPLFHNRHHLDRSICRMPAHHQRGVWFDPSLKGKKLFPHWKILWEYLKVVHKAPSLCVISRIRCYGIVLAWLLRNWNGVKLGLDIVLNLFPAGEKHILLIHEKMSRMGRNRFV